MLASSPDSPYRIGHLLLRVGVALSFLYPPLAALSDPLAWAGYFPQFIANLPVDTMVLLHAFGVVEVAIAFWILSGRSIRVPSLLAAGILLAIVAVNVNDFAVLFRDVSIALAALALAVLPPPRSS